jgi:hypothetical protein
MNKRINFEDTIFILNVRIRMIRDLLQLDTDTDFFVRQTMGDLEYSSSTLEMLTKKFLENIKFLDSETEADNILDAEWQFNQLLNEISNNNSPYSPVRYPETQNWILKLKNDSGKRQKLIEESCIPMGQSVSEPVVSHAELNGLLGNN